MSRPAEGWKVRPDKRTGIYYVRFTFRRHRFEFSTHERDPEKARQIAGEIYRSGQDWPLVGPILGAAPGMGEGIIITILPGNIVRPTPPEIDTHRSLWS